MMNDYGCGKGGLDNSGIKKLDRYMVINDAT